MYFDFSSGNEVLKSEYNNFQIDCTRPEFNTPRRNLSVLTLPDLNVKMFPVTHKGLSTKEAIGYFPI
jgi:hypothetical protein